MTTRVSQYQKGKTNLDFTQARDSEWQWHQLGHMQVCNSLQTDNHASTPLLTFLQAGCPSCRPTNSVKALKNKLKMKMDMWLESRREFHLQCESNFFTSLRFSEDFFFQQLRIFQLKFYTLKLSLYLYKTTKFYSDIFNFDRVMLSLSMVIQSHYFCTTVTDLVFCMLSWTCFVVMCKAVKICDIKNLRFERNFPKTSGM